MSWEELHGVIKNWSNLNDERPFLNQQAPFLLDAAEEGLTRQYPDLELATLAILELEHRESPKAIKSASKIRAMLDDRGHEPILWLMHARKNLQFLKFEDEPNKNYTNSLYVILRDGFVNVNGRYGVYVGQTSKTPDERLDEHLSGIKAGRGVAKNGIQLMHSLMWPWGKVPGKKALLYESALHKAILLNNFRGPVVSGDAVNPVNWPPNFQLKLKQKLEI